MYSDSPKSIKVNIGNDDCEKQYVTNKSIYCVETVLFKSNVSKIYLAHIHYDDSYTHKKYMNEKYIIKKYFKEFRNQARNEYKILKNLNSKYILSIVDEDVKNGLLVMNKYSHDLFDLLVTCQTNGKKLTIHSLKKYFTE